MNIPICIEWLLDVVINDATLSPQFANITTPLWLVIASDGLARPFSTPSVHGSPNPTWKYPVRLVLSFESIDKAYLYISLCTYEANVQGKVKSLGNCRISIKSIPTGGAQMIGFPIYDPKDLTNEVAMMRFCATISPYTPHLQDTSYRAPDNFPTGFDAMAATRIQQTGIFPTYS